MRWRLRATISAGLLALTIAVAGPAAHATLVVVDLATGGAIPDCCGVSTFLFSVGASGRVADVDVRFAARHEYINDIDVLVEAPDGTRVILFDGIFLFNGRFQDTYFDQDAGACTLGKTGCLTPPFAGPEYAGGRTYQPEWDSLDRFDGKPAAGTWKLLVYDGYYGGAGAVYKAGDAAPWGTAIGSQLILTIVPEPSTLALLAGGVALLARRRTNV